jgi:AcrR family transcriptional regulator
VQPPGRVLSTADARREEVIAAARHVMAARGFHGTPTTEIAKAAGISQAYLFRLFPTKLELFLALTEDCFERVSQTFTDAARRARAAGENALAAMGMAYGELLADRDVLLLQLHTYAAADEPRIRDAVRRGYAQLVDVVRRESGADDGELRDFFAMGMLMNVVAAMRADEVDEPWAKVLMDPSK